MATNAQKSTAGRTVKAASASATAAEPASRPADQRAEPQAKAGQTKPAKPSPPNHPRQTTPATAAPSRPENQAPVLSYGNCRARRRHSRTAAALAPTGNPRRACDRRSVQARLARAAPTLDPGCGRGRGHQVGPTPPIPGRKADPRRPRVSVRLTLKALQAKRRFQGISART
jgi:hypothetical protein